MLTKQFEHLVANTNLLILEILNNIGTKKLVCHNFCQSVYDFYLTGKQKNRRKKMREAEKSYGKNF